MADASDPVRHAGEFGIVPSGEERNTAAIQKGLDTLSQAGGGVLYFPPGDYLTGTVQLRDRVTLYLEAGATLWGSSRREDYTEDCLVYADGAADAAIRGRGVIDGQGESFWVRDEERNKWVTGAWRPDRLMRLVRCSNLLIEDVTVRNSPAWTLHLVACEGVVVRGISILNGIYEDDGPNTDGIVPDGCAKVRISDCYIQTGDDSIVLKNTAYENPTGVCRDITVTGCVIISSETALKIGSESHGEFRNITFSNCTVRDAGCGIGLWMRDGGLIDGWRVDNITMTLTGGGTPIYLWAYRRTDETPWGTVRNVSITRVTAAADGAIFITGVPHKPMERIHIEDVNIFMRGGRQKVYHADPPYPIEPWGHRKCTSDIFCRHVDGLTLRHVRLVWNDPEDPEWGSAIRMHDVRDLELDGFQGRQARGSGAPAVRLDRVDGLYVHSCWPPPETGAFLSIDEATRKLTITGNNFEHVERVVVGAHDDSDLFTAANRPAGEQDQVQREGAG